jgi:hypothetical protein
MRLPLMALPLLLAAVACGAPTGLDTAVIAVQVRDDIGKSAGRQQLIIQRVDAAEMSRRVDTGTDRDGRASVPVSTSGMYEVRVIPSDGFVSSASLRRTIVVVEGERTDVTFTLYRGGNSELNAERTPWNGEAGWP